ncbi:hypothetical protein QA596_03400 [Balneolales bacterium ANBcel1]|nr:hypothetical protein [Balneolales bacterium ANBcel1]
MKLLMMRALSLFLLLLFSSLLLVHCGSADPDREANRLFVEAFTLVERAGEQERESLREAHQNYQQALANIDRIIEEYPETQVAVNVTQQQTRIGEMTIGELRRKVPVFEARAGALAGFPEMSRYLIGRIGDEVTRAERFIRLGHWYHEHGESPAEALEQAAQIAHRHWSTEVSDPIYNKLSVAYARFGEWPEALELADRIQNRQLLFDALEAIIGSGYVAQGQYSGNDPLLRLVEFAGPTRSAGLRADLVRELFGHGLEEAALDLADLPLPDPEGDALAHIDALTGLAEAYASNGAFEPARHVIEQIKRLDEDYADFALRDLSIELASRRMMEDAIAVVSGFDRDYFRETALAGIAVEFARNGQVTEALNILDEVPDQTGEKLDAYVEIAWLLTDFMDHERSDSLLQIVRPLMEDGTSPLQKIELKLRITDIYVMRNTRPEAAETLLQTGEILSDITSTGHRNRFLHRIAHKWLNLGRPDRILDMAAQFDMEHEHFDRLFTELLEAAVDAGYNDLALRLAGMSNRQHYYTYRLTDIHIRQNQFERAARIAYDIRNYYWRVLALAEASQGFAGSGDELLAAKAAADTLQFLSRIRLAEESEEALEYASSRMASAGITMNNELQSLAESLIGNLQ